MKRASLALALLGVAACRRTTADVKPEAVPIAVVSASASAASPPPPLASAAPAKASTRGTIACGATRCRAEVEGCLTKKDGTRSCVVLANVHEGAIYACDDASDCTTEGETCCAPTLASASCTTPNAVDSAPCGFEVCNTDDGAPPCPSGQSCVKGICRPEAPGVTCGKTRCPKDAPYCVWTAGAGKCVSASDAERAREAARQDEKAPSVFECTKPGDCGTGFQCCSVREYDLMATRTVRVTQCRYGCDDTQFDDVCEKPGPSAECPVGMSFGANGGAVTRTCRKRVPSKTYPAWMGECVAR